MKLELRTPEALRSLLAEASWQRLFAEVAAFSPAGSLLEETVAALFRHHQIVPRLDLEHMQVVDRAMADRYLAVLLQYELAYGTLRLARARATEAARWFLRPFGSDARFYTSIELTPAILAAKEARGNCGFGVWGGIFGSTLEEGLVAFDPAGIVGALFVGDED